MRILLAGGHLLYAYDDYFTFLFALCDVQNSLPSDGDDNILLREVGKNGKNKPVRMV